MEKNEAQRFQIDPERFSQVKIDHKIEMNNNTSRAATLDRRMDRSQSHMT